METSPTTKELTAALCQFQASQHRVAKTSFNPAFKTKYVGISEVLATVLGPLTEVGLSFVQFPDGEHGLTTRLMHVSGEYLQATYTMRPTKPDPQGVGSALTYARRYALLAVLGLGTEDDDGHAASQPLPTNAFRPVEPAPVEVGPGLEPETKRLIGKLCENDLITLEEKRTIGTKFALTPSQAWGSKTVAELNSRIATRSAALPA